jgi:hypothetical protein
MLRGDVFQCDEKYENYIEELKSRGWELEASDPGLPVPSSCSFICKNLSKLKFATVFDRHVNHLRGSQHLSNKAFLTSHLKAAGCGNVQPPTWSSAIDDISTLIEMLAINEAVSIANELLETGGALSDSLIFEGRLALLQGVRRSLLQQEGWARGVPAKILTDVLTKLSQAVANSGELHAASGAGEVLAAVLEHCASSGFVDLSARKNIWLIKAVGLSCGESITIKSTIPEILTVVSKDMSYKCVVQKYIERPLLLRRRNKFDIRQWVLVTSANPLVIYGFSQCYLRLSSQSYSLDTSGLGNNLIHLTNNAIQKATAPTGSGSCADPLYHPLMMTQSEFSQYLEDQRAQGLLNVDLNIAIDETLFEGHIKTQMKAITIASITAVRDKLEKVGRGYEWLGIDYMITDTLDVKLLEINTSPDTTYSTPITEWLVKAATRDLMDLVLDEKLTVVSEIKKTRGGRSAPAAAVSEAAAPLAPAWELWHCGPAETKAQIQSFSARKTDACGAMDPEHRPRGSVDCLTRILAYPADGFWGESDLNKIGEDEDEDEL